MKSWRLRNASKFTVLCPYWLKNIRSARFLEDFIINENYVCRLFVPNAQYSLAETFAMYSHDIHVVSTCNLRSVISDIFLGCRLPYVHLVKLIFSIFFFF